MTEQHHPNTITRLQRFPGIQSITVHLDIPVQHAFKYYKQTDDGDYDIHSRRYTGLMHFDQSLLEATFSLEHLCDLTLDVPSGDRLCALPWEGLSDLLMLSIRFTERVAQGTFGFLSRIPSLEELHIDNIDFLSVPCLVCLTNLTTLDISLAPPDKGVLSIEQASERSDDMLSWISKLTTLKKLDFSQQATTRGIAYLAALPNLTSLTLRLPARSDFALSLWELETMLQKHWFCLKHLRFEFKLDGNFATASLSDAGTDSSEGFKRSSGLQFWVPWSATSILIKAGV